MASKIIPASGKKRGGLLCGVSSRTLQLPDDDNLLLHYEYPLILVT